jgi:hypothetical protein
MDRDLGLDRPKPRVDHYPSGIFEEVALAGSDPLGRDIRDALIGNNRATTLLGANHVLDPEVFAET